MNTLRLNKFVCWVHFLYILLLSFYVNAQTTPAGFNLVAYEGFDYISNSSLLNASGGTGWSTNWTKSYMSKYLKTGTVGFAYTGLATSGLKAEFDDTCYDVDGISPYDCNAIASLGRSFPLQNKGVVYFQFISVFEASPGGGTPTVRLFDGATLTGGIGSSSGSNMSILAASLANLSSSSGSLSAQNLVVVRIDYDLNKTEMWINPDLTTFDYLSPTSPSATATGFAPAFDRIDIFLRSGSIDEITVYREISGLNKYGNRNANISQAVNKNGIVGYGNGLNPNGKIFSSWGNGSTQATASISAYQIKQDFPSSTDGVYWITNPNINSGTPFQIYADMTTDGGGWMLLNVGAGNSSAPESNTVTSPSVLGYLPRATVIELAKLCTDVQLRAGNSSTSYANKTTSTSPLAIGALQSVANDVNGTATWANGASSTFVVNSGSWLWAYCCPGVASGWPRMYHSSNYTHGVHWFADLGTGRKNSNPRDAWFSTWIR